MPKILNKSRRKKTKIMKKITLLLILSFIAISTQAQNKLLSSISEYYDSLTSTWKKSSGSNYKYDNNNNLIEDQGFYFDENGVGKDDGKILFTYNTNNKITEELYYSWNETTNQYEVDERDTYQYVSNRLTEISYQEWINGNWVNDGKYIVTYNTNNLPEMVVELSWNGIQWVNEFQTTYTYNTNNKIISDIEQNWENSQWVNSRKALYIYNINNKLTAVEGANWDKFNNNWVADDENVFDYVLDTTGNRISSKESSYDVAYTYDTTQLLSSFAHPFKDKTGLDYFGEDFPYVNKLLSETSNNGTNRITYNYNSAITLSTPNIEKASATLTVYPNPTIDILNIENPTTLLISKIIVTDMTGKKVLEQNNAGAVNVQYLAKGIYVLEALVGDKKETRKFIKDK